MRCIIQILRQRDGLSKSEAIAAFNEGVDTFKSRRLQGENCDNLCEELFNLENDHLQQIIDAV